MKILSVRNGKGNKLANFHNSLLLDVRFDSSINTFMDYVKPRNNWPNAPHHPEFLYPILNSDGYIIEYTNIRPNDSLIYKPYNKYLDSNNIPYYKFEDNIQHLVDTLGNTITTYKGIGAIPPFWKIKFHSDLYPLNKSDNAYFDEFIRSSKCEEPYDETQPFLWSIEYLQKIKTEGFKVLNAIDDDNWYLFLSLRSSDNCIDRIIIADKASKGLRQILSKILNFDERTKWFIKYDIAYPEHLPNYF